MATPTLEEMEARAQRHLDGMTVNRDAMALDVLRLTKAIRAAQKRAAEINAAKKATGGGYAGAFAGIFDDIWGPGR